MNPVRSRVALLVGASSLALSAGAAAQVVGPAPVATPAPAPADEEYQADPNGIVITAERLPGSVDTDLPVELELDEAAIASYGASSVDDLLTALAPQTGSARGRGDGRPVVLINGQRTSGFRDIRDLPPEAIARVQVFPEELAIQYGYRPDQRVVNVILKPNFRSANVQLGYGFATGGDFETNELDATVTRIGKAARVNLNLDVEPTSRLLEADRGIVQSRVDPVTGLDEGRFRTLLAGSTPMELAATGSVSLGPRSTLQLSAEYDRTRTLSLLGLPAATFAVPGTSPFSRTGQDATVTRLFAGGGALQRDGRSDTLSFGATANGPIGRFRYSATASHDRGLSGTATQRQPSAAALVAGVAAGDPTLDPFAPGLALAGDRTVDTTRSLSGRTELNATLSGSPLRLPAGEAQLSITSQARLVTLDTRARGRTVSDVGLERRGALIRGSVVLPVTSRREGFGGALGDLSLNANGGVQRLSDFGALTEYGYGVTWTPLSRVTLTASVIGEQAAPTLTQLGAPQLLTPNAPVFDGRTGATVFADVLTGGNPDLRREGRRDRKLAVNWSPAGLTGERGDSTFTVEYLTNRSDDVTAGFPLLTPAIEAAFPDRVTRGPDGALLRLDQRPVTFDRLRSSRLRFGFSLSGSLGAEPERGGFGAGGGGRRARGDPSAEPSPVVAPSSAGRLARGAGGRPGTGAGAVPSPASPTTEAPPAGARTPAPPPGNPIGRAFGGGRGGRWNLSVFDVWQLTNRVTVRPGVPELDLLGGDVTDGSTPIARHQVQLEGGAFKDGLGLRVTGAYTSNAVLADRGSGMVSTAAGDLAFGDLFTLSARVFANFDQRADVLAAVPFLKGSRLALRVDNLFGGVRAVRDPLGRTPRAFQPGFLDPRGRVLEVSLRKRF